MGWPPLVVRALGWPEGTNIAFTDSIPLVAIPTRLLRGMLPAGGHTILLWLALSYALQPVAAVYALRSMGETRLLPGIAVAMIVMNMPALLWRSGHAALSAHFLILLAIGLYFRLCTGSRGAAWIGVPLLLPVSLLVHPYLLTMAAVVLAAAPVSLLARRDAASLAACRTGQVCGRMSRVRAENGHHISYRGRMTQ